jgi:hypothetical protein
VHSAVTCRTGLRAVCRMKGKPDLFVTYSPDIKFHTLTHALWTHCQPQLHAGYSPSVWLSIFALCHDGKPVSAGSLSLKAPVHNSCAATIGHEVGASGCEEADMGGRHEAWQHFAAVCELHGLTWPLQGACEQHKPILHVHADGSIVTFP